MSDHGFQALGHGRSRSDAENRGQRAAQGDLHRRDLLDGRRHREAARPGGLGAQIRRNPGRRRLTRDWRARQMRPRHGGALRHAGPDRRDHLHTRQSPRRSGGRLYGRPNRAHRLPHAALAAAALQQCPAADRRSERARRGAARRALSRARQPAVPERPLLPRAAPLPRLQTAAGRDAHRAGDPGRDREGDSYERAIAGRRRLRDWIRLPCCAARTCACALPALGRPFA